MSPPLYRITVYANDATGAELENIEPLPLPSLGVCVADAMARWEGTGRDVRLIVARSARTTGLKAFQEFAAGIGGRR